MRPALNSSCRTSYLVLFAAFCLVLGVVPLQAQKTTELVVRHSHYFVVVNDTDSAPTVSARSKSFFRYPEGLALEVIDDQAVVRLQTMLPLGTEVSKQIPGPVAPFYLVVAKPGMNGVVFDADRPWGIVVGNQGMGSNGAVPRMYLYVPQDCPRFTITCLANSPNEGGRVTVLKPDGADAVALDGEFDSSESREIRVLPEHRGKVWSFIWAKPRTVTASLDDLVVILTGNFAPLLWQKREWAVTCGPVMWQRHKAALAAQTSGL